MSEKEKTLMWILIIAAIGATAFGLYEGMQLMKLKNNVSNLANQFGLDLSSL